MQLQLLASLGHAQLHVVLVDHVLTVTSILQDLGGAGQRRVKQLARHMNKTALPDWQSGPLDEAAGYPVQAARAQDRMAGKACPDCLQYTGSCESCGGHSQLAVPNQLCCRYTET